MATILVIDDSNTIRRSAELFLKSAGHTVLLASDGFEALPQIVQTPPDLIFIDVMMPRLDGYQTCALLKKNEQFRHIPVVMLTSKDGVFDRARGALVGCDEYLTKPFTKTELLETVARHTQKGG